MEPKSPALEDRFLTTGPPGKSPKPQHLSHPNWGSQLVEWGWSIPSVPCPNSWTSESRKIIIINCCFKSLSFIMICYAAVQHGNHAQWAVAAQGFTPSPISIHTLPLCEPMQLHFFKSHSCDDNLSLFGPGIHFHLLTRSSLLTHAIGISKFNSYELNCGPPKDVSVSHSWNLRMWLCLEKESWKMYKVKDPEVRRLSWIIHCPPNPMSRVLIRDTQRRDT